MKKFFTISLISLLGITSLLAAEGSNFFGFRGKVYLEDGKGKNVTVNLYDGNKKVSSYITGAAGKFLIDINRNRYYTVEFVKEGYVTKRIVIDTKINYKDAVDVKEFKFDIELIKELTGKDYSMLDFPITILQFQKHKKEFVFNKKYTEKMLEIQNNLLIDSDSMALN